MTGRRVRGLGNLRFHQHFLILPHHLCFGQPHLPYKDLGLKIEQHDQDRDGVGGDEPEVLDPGLILPRAAGPAQRPPGRASFALFRSFFFGEQVLRCADFFIRGDTSGGSPDSKMMKLSSLLKKINEKIKFIYICIMYMVS